MSYSMEKTLQYAVTPAQESGALVHTFRRRRLGIVPTVIWLQSLAQRPAAVRAGVLTANVPRIQ
ncbi:hypothetical protein BRAS3843_990022 [Bradyrhizobium sp. STM 3843]|nr:hypothetical protein BRAS3843_990022 [Bradyrhizobium sp. STM 3843]